jgi:trimeric autotransporter adhesin
MTAAHRTGIEELEARILYSADAALLLGGVPVADVRSVDTAQAVPAAPAASHWLVVDRRVEDWDLGLADRQARDGDNLTLSVLLIDAEGNGRAQLAGLTGAVEVMPWTDPQGQCWLGATPFDAEPAATSPAAAESPAVTDSGPSDRWQAEVRHELVVIDGGVEGASQLAMMWWTQATASCQIEVVVTDPARDGLAQITELLSTRADLSAVHLVSHGNAGLLQLGTTTVDASVLAARAGEVAGWRQALTADADLLVYGCDVAQGFTGAAFVHQLSDLTGADVAASTDLTGSAEAGGDWTLEVQTGQIEHAAAFDAATQVEWQGTLATYTVTNLNDSGAGSLRQAITNANANGGADAITFSAFGTINLASALPQITGQVSINGTNGSAPGIVLNGGNTVAIGLDLVAGSSSSTIRGLVLQAFTDYGISISSSSGTTIAGNYIGTNAGGNVAVGNGIAGVNVVDAASITIGGTTAADRNVISGNSNIGVNIVGAGSAGTVVSGNYIGTNASGSADLGNTWHGVYLNSVSGVTIGGSVAGAGNVVSGNGSGAGAVGITLGAAATGNVVAGNIVGLNAAGTGGLANSGIGIYVLGASNTIGGTVAAARNVVSGNTTMGINISGASADGNTVIGNYIGTSVTGLTALGNGADGLQIDTGASGNSIGGLTAAERNVISGNSNSGVAVDGAASVGNLVIGNYIGLGANGSTSLGNTDNGVTVFQSTDTVIGSTDPAGRNIISANALSGVSITDAQRALVKGNYIGTDATGTLARGNAQDGVRMNGSTDDAVIGGDAVGAGNLIANNTGDGVLINTASGKVNTVIGNAVTANGETGIDLGADDGVTANDFIGDGDTGANNLQNFPVLTSAASSPAGTTIAGSLTTNILGTYRIDFYANHKGGEDGTGYGEGERYLGFTTVSSGVLGTVAFNATLTDAWVNNGDRVTATATVDLGGGVYGATSEFAMNVVATASGVVVVDTTADTIDGNTTSITALGNSRGGDQRISLREAITAANNTANGATPDKIVFGINGFDAHTIALTSLLPTISQAVVIDGTSDDSFAVQGDQPVIVLDGGGLVLDGLRLYAGSDGSTVRGLNIQRFLQDGIDISGSGGNTVAGNWIGVGTDGVTDRGNQQGVNVWNGNNNTIGGSTAADRNVIAGNSGMGIWLGGGATGNQIQGNYVGTTAAGDAALRNDVDGILIESAGNTVGGIQAGQRNVISGNGRTGIMVNLAAATGNVVIGNYIGTDSTGTADLNGTTKNSGLSGVVITGGASGNRIGTNADGSGDTAERNIISGNNWYGVELIGVGTSNNVVQGNYIGTDVTGLVALGNSQGGVSFWNGASGNQVGSGLTGAGNVISGNETGVLVANGVSNNWVQGNLIGLGADGTTAVGNTGAGVYLYNGGFATAVTGNLIGSNADGSNDTGERNVISANYNGVALENAEVTGNTVAGNYIGTDATGMLDRGNLHDGVLIQNGANANTIGGSSAVQRNVISGNAGIGIVANAFGVSILGNYVGVDATGNNALRNDSYGIDVGIDGPGVTIGGAAVGAGNVVSGNGNAGVLFEMGSSGTVKGNLIGTNATGTASIAGNGAGIYLATSNVLVGGKAAGERNTVTGSSTAGIIVAGAVSGNALLGNAVYGNAGLAIDLENDGITANDAAPDTDTGANNLQNFPVLATARTDASSQLFLTGTLTSAASSYYRIEFFANTSQDSTGYGQGQRYLGYANVATDASGNATISTTLGASVAVGEFISATATKSNATYTTFTDTSEFARNIAAVDSTQAVVTVDTTSDTSDGDTTSLSTLLANKGADGFISLREAITAANNTANGTLADRVTFNITGTGVHTITPLTALPVISNAVILDATTDDSFAANSNRPAIVLDGNSLNAEGLTLANTADGSTIRGFVIRDFNGHAIQISAGSDGHLIAGNYLGSYDATGADAGAGEANLAYGLYILGANNTVGGLTAADRNVIGGNDSGIVVNGSSATGNTVSGNYIGTDATGAVAVANTFDGIRLYNGATGNTIGGTTSAHRNVIAGNSDDGIQIDGETSDGNTIQGNFIGMNATGTATLANGVDGILITSGADNTVIGGTGAAEHNVIGGSGQWGIELWGASSGTRIRGNYIGTDEGATLNLGNTYDGVAIGNGATGNTVGGTLADEGNTIAFNRAGVAIWTAGTGNAMLGNAIYSNAQTGIDLSTSSVLNGLTANDTGDADTGGNNLQNFPVLATARTDGSSQITLTGTLNSSASSYYRIEFFSNASQDGTGYGEGQTYLGFVNVATNGSGNASINATLTANVPVGAFISATATKSDASYTTFTDTSEFAQNIAAMSLNTAPVNTVPGAQTTSEDVAKVFSAGNGNAISIADSDAGGANNQVTLSVTNGTLTLSTTSGLSFTAGDGTADSTMTLRGSAAAINAALEGLSYAPTANYNGGAVLTLATKDAVLLSLDIDTGLLGRYAFENTGALGTDTSPAAGYPGTVSGSTAVSDGTRGNVISMTGAGYVQTTGHFGNPANVTLAAWVNLAAPDSQAAEVISLGDSVVLRLDEAGQLKGFFYTGTTWTYTNYSVTLAGTGWHHAAYTFNDAGNTATLYLDGTAVASTSTTNSISYTLGANSFIGKHGNGETIEDFNGKIDEARVYNRALTSTEIATLASDLTMTDTDTVAITVTAVNDAPVVNTTGSALAFAENQAATTVDPGLTVSDVDNANLASATVSITANFAAGEDTLAFTNQLGITGSWNAGTGVLTLTGSATLADYQTALRSITYANASDVPSTAARTVSFSVNDGAAGSNTGTRNISVTATNDAPVLAATALTLTVAEDAGVPSGVVGSLVGAFTGGISDVDSGAVKGIAIIASDETNGAWYYSTNGGTTWTAVGAVSSASSLLLADDASTRLYFAPIVNFNGSAAAALTLRGWDQTSDAAGLKVSTASHGGITAFSSATDVVDVMVTAVNDAPVLDNTGATTLPALTKIQTSNGGAAVATIIASAGGDRITDADAGAVEGIAITTLASGNGNWQFSTDGGGSWTDVGVVSNTSALLLRDIDYVRFVPNGVSGTTASVDFRAWDQTTGTAGTKVTTASNGGATAFSTTTETANITVSDVNAAPALDSSKSPVLNAQNEDAGAPVGAVGTLVSALVDFASPAGQVDNVTDADAGASLGIAVTGVNTGNGNWWYSIDNGTNWSALGAVSDANALLLAADANTRLYFQANANYFGSASSAITFRAWDQTTGANGATASVSITNTVLDTFSSASYTNNDGTQIWSSGWVETDSGAGPTVGKVQIAGGRLRIDAAPSAPNIYRQVDLSAASTATLSYSFDATTLATSALMLVQITGDGGASYTTLATYGAGATTGTPSHDITAFMSGNTRVRVINSSNGAGSILFDDVQITYAATGGSSAAFSIGTDTASLTVDPVADTPSITNATTSEDTQSTSGLVISRNAADGAEVTHFKLTGISNGTLYLNDGTTALGNGSFITFAQGNAGLKFTPAADFNGSGSFSVQASTSGNDAGLGGGTVNATIAVNAVNDAPVASGSATLASVDEDTAASPGASVTTLFSANFFDAQDQVASGSSADTLAGIAISSYTVDAARGNWQYSNNAGASWTTLTSASTTAAVTLNAADLLRFVPADNYAGAATALAAHLIESGGVIASGSVTDLTGSTGGSTHFSAATVALAHTITAVNDAPGLSTSVMLSAISEDISNHSGFLVSGIAGFATDADAGAVQGLFISAVDDGHGTWQYTLDGSNWLAIGNVSTASARLLPSDATARVRFVPNANWNGLTGMFSYGAWDQTSGSAGGLADVTTRGSTTAFSLGISGSTQNVTAVNDAPVASGSATLAAVNEDVASPPGATIASLFSANFSDATDQVSGGSSANAFAGIAISSYTVDAARGQWQYSTDTGSSWTTLGSATAATAITLDSAAGTMLRFVSAADYNGAATALSANLIESGLAITNGASINLTGVTGGSTRISLATVALSETVTAVNDAPTVTTTGTPQTYTENAAAEAIDPDLTIGDVDNATLTGASVSVSANYASGQDVLAFANQLGITGSWNAGTGVLTLTGSATLADYQAALRSVTYANGSDNPSMATRTVSFSVSDGVADSIVGTRDLGITAVNDAPVITSDGGGSSAAVVVAENTTAVTTVTSSDVDGGTPVYSLSGGADAASFTIDASTGVLSFLTAPDYEAPTDSDGNNVYDVSVQVSDGAGGIQVQAIAVTVTDVSSTLVVTTTADTNDTGLGSSFTAEQLNANKGTDGHVSLREALIAANTTVGTDHIGFNIAGTGVHTINVATALPSITDQVVLDATTDDSFAANANRPAIVLDGNGLAAAGLTLAAGSGGSTVRGLVIVDFNAAALSIATGSDGNAIAGNTIGLLADGDTAAANNLGVVVASSGNTIGGTVAADRNVLSGNVNAGVSVSGSSNLVIGNYIGTDATGLLDRGSSGGDGVDVYGGSGNRIGGTTAAERNIISGNNRQGIELYGAATGVQVQGNYIGTDATGTQALGNGQGGLWVGMGTANHTIGGTAAGAGNLIAYNQGTLYQGGVLVESTVTGISVLGNRFLGNTGAAIDLGMDGVTANDAGDGDTGANGLQNFPVLASAYRSGADTKVTGSLDSTAGTSYRIEFYSSPTGDSNGHGEGAVYLGATTVTTNGSGQASFSATLTGVTVTAGQVVSATATVDLGGGNYGSTSEFAANVTATDTVPAIAVQPLGHTSEGQSNACFSVVLATAPTADVTIALSVDDSTELSLGVSSLVFTSANWNVAQTVTVTGVDDTLVDGAVWSNVRLAPAVSADVAYNGLDPADVSIQNADNDTVNTLTVTTASDTFDGDTSSIAALIANRGTDGRISLREAITAANNTANAVGGADRIVFDIADPLVGGAHTITLSYDGPDLGNRPDALPTVTEAAVIDATTDADWAAAGGAPVVVIDGSAAAASADGLAITAGNSTVRGLVISNFGHYGLYLATGGGNTIEGNFIGTNVAGSAAAGNSWGIVVDNSANNVIGGTTAAAGNLISGNANDGINLDGLGSTGNQIQGNRIGTNLAGTASIGNLGVGIGIGAGASGNMVGGPGSADRNLISGNAQYGIFITDAATSGNVVQSNWIGVNAAGTGALTNGGFGVVVDLKAASTTIVGNVISGNTATGWSAARGGLYLYGYGVTIQGNLIGLDATGSGLLGNGGGTGNTAGIVVNDGSTGVHIGGTGVGEGNAIAGNTGAGVTVMTTGAQTTLLGNTFRDNTGLAIDLGNDGLTANDAGDVDTGANTLLNTPRLYSAELQGADVRVRGEINTTAGLTLRIEFFSSTLGTEDPTGYGEGSTWLGYTEVTTDGTGRAAIDVTLAGVAPATGDRVSATTTVKTGPATYGATSEFAMNVPAAEPNQAPVLTLSASSYSYTENAAALYDPGATLTDSDNPVLNGGQFIAQVTANGTATDELGIRNQGTGAGQIGLSGGDVTYGGTVIGTTAGFGNGSTPLVVSFNGNATTAAVQALLRNVTYRDTSDNPGTATRTIELTVSDGSGGTSVPAVVGIAVVAVNDAPVLTNGGAISVSEGSVGAPFSGVATLNDADNASFTGGTLTATISAGGESTDVLQVSTLSTVSTSGANVLVNGVAVGTWSGGTGGAALVVSFNASATVSRAQAVYEALGLRTSSDNPTSGLRTVSVVLTDGSGGTSNTATAQVNLLAVNDAPVFGNLNGVPAYTEGAAAVVLDMDVTVSDAELTANNHFSGATLTLVRNGGASAQDQFSATGTLGALIQGGSLVVGGTTLGSVTANSSGTLVLTLNANATTALVQSAMQQIAYANSSPTPPASVQIDWSFSDGNAGAQGSGGALSANGSTTVAITAVNSAPVITAADAGVAYAEGSGPAFVADIDLVLSDLDSADFSGGALTVSLAAGGVPGQDVLGFFDQGSAPSQIGLSGTTVTYGGVGIGTFSGGSAGADLVVSFNASASRAAVESLMLVTTYANTDTAAPTPGVRTIRFVLSDGDSGTSNAYDTTVVVSGVNDVPVFAGLDGTPAYTEGGPAAVLDANVQISDAELGAADNFSGATLTLVRNGGANIQDLFSATGSLSALTEGGSLVVGGTAIGTVTTNSAGSLVLSFDAGATNALVNAVMRQVAYANSSDTPPASVQIDWIFSDGNTGAQGTGGALSAGGHTTVALTAVNDAPVITSLGGGTSAALSIAENTTAVATITATDVDDATGLLRYSIVGGADAARFTIDASSGALSFLSTPDYEVPTDAGADNRYDVTVQVSDGTLTDTQTIAVTVTAVNDNAPTITSDGAGATAAVSVAENTTAVTTVAATDADWPAPLLTYNISGGADAARFTIDASTGALRFVSAPDHEAPSDVGADNVYDVIVQVSDGSRTDVQAIAVTVTGVNDISPAITSGGTVSVAENTTAVTTVTATDTDQPTQALTYSIIGGEDAARFTIDAASGALSFRKAPDYEAPSDANADNVYDVTVQASDGSLTASQSIVVTITDVNDNTPTITSGSAVGVTENATAVTTVTASDADQPAQTLTFSIVGGADGDRFTIDAATGALSFRAAPDYEVPSDDNADNVYDVTVQVSDGSLTASQAIAVTLTDVNDNAPTISSGGAVSVDENTTAVTTVTASDADLPAQTLTFSIIGGVDAARFTIDATTGALSFVSAPDYEAPTDAGVDNVYDVTVQVSDGHLADTQAITVRVTGTNDNAPAFSSDSVATAVTLSAPEGAPWSMVLSASDADLPAQALTFRISGGADAALFELDPASGLLTFRLAADHEAPQDANQDNVYEVAVSVSDGTLAVFRTLTLLVINVNETPVLVTSQLSVAQGGQVVLDTGMLQSTDPDTGADGLVYAVSDVRFGAFEQISSPGQAVERFTQADVAAGQIVFVQSGGSAVASFSLTVSDGDWVVGPRQVKVLVQPAASVPPMVARPPSFESLPAPGSGSGQVSTSGGGLQETLAGAGAVVRLDRIRPEIAASGNAEAATPGAGRLTTTDRDSDSSVPSSATGAEPARGSGLVRAMAVSSSSVGPGLLAERAGGVRSGSASDSGILPDVARLAASDLLVILDAPIDLSGFTQERSALLQWLYMDERSRGTVDAVQQQSQSDEVPMLRWDSGSAVKVGGMALSVGLVFWATRATGLVASLIAVSPPWRQFDPLPVLSVNAPQQPVGTEVEWLDTDIPGSLAELAEDILDQRT